MYDRTRKPTNVPSRQPNLRRNPHSWFAFRLFLGFLGAALVLLPLALPESWIASIFGLVFFLTSILLPPTREVESTEQRPLASAEQLVLTGAEYTADGSAPVPVKLFVSEQQLLAMKPNLQPAVVIPFTEAASVFLQRSENSWFLILQTQVRETVFSFHGIFAERNARRAESAILPFVRSTPPERPKARAVGA